MICEFKDTANILKYRRSSDKIHHAVYESQRVDRVTRNIKVNVIIPDKGSVSHRTSFKNTSADCIGTGKDNDFR